VSTCPSCPGRQINSKYDPNSSVTTLPKVVDRAATSPHKKSDKGDSYRLCHKRKAGQSD
jgi:hypothetical protein